MGIMVYSLLWVMLDLNPKPQAPLGLGGSELLNCVSLEAPQEYLE